MKGLVSSATLGIMADTAHAEIYCRGVNGLWRAHGTTPPFSKDSSFPSEGGRSCKCLTFSSLGDYAAWYDGQILKIFSVKDNKVLHNIETPSVNLMQFSPLSSILAIWQPFTVKDKKPSRNLILYDVKSGSVITQFIQKKPQFWYPQWSQDEAICARNNNNEVQFYENNDFSTVKTKIQIQKVSQFSLAPCSSPYTVACYVAGVKGLPGNVRLFRYPDFGGLQSALASKSFFKAERVNLSWNNKGSALLILTSTETSDSSYYGEQGLHFLAVNGDSCVVPLGKNGPVYSTAWHPSGTEFTVVYGYMPAKVTIYNMKNDPIFDFGTGPRNQVYYNRFGNMLCLAGFGNLQGNLEFWDLEKYKLISTVSAKDATFFEWAPDGRHAVSATLAPRMRVGNGYKIWHYTGSLMKQESVGDDSELWQVNWGPVPDGVFTKPVISYKAVETTEKAPVQTKAPAYRPPGARGKPSTVKVHEYELPSNQKPPPGTSTDGPPLSKNQKRKRAKAAAQAAAASGGESGSGSNQGTKTTGNQSQAPAASAAADVKSESKGGAHVVELTGDPEKDKKIRNLTKKLQQIQKLKDDLAAGVALQTNQLEKLKKEDELVEELHSIALS